MCLDLRNWQYQRNKPRFFSNFKMKGQLTIIDLYGCDENLVRSRDKLEQFGKELCKVIEMTPFGEPIVKRFGKGDLEGHSSVVQLIETSNITIHLDEFENKAFIDIFSCKDFDVKKAENFCKDYFKAKESKMKTIFRE